MSRINTLQARDFVYWIMTSYGQHVFGANDAPLNMVLADDDFDGSDMTAWAANQVGSWLPSGYANQLTFCYNRGLMLPVATGLVTAGALLWSRYIVAVSLGDGKRTVEPLHRVYGLRLDGAVNQSATRWVASAVVPAVVY